MKYINRLQTANVDHVKIRKESCEDITSFLVYLMSSKFHDDPTIQTKEVVSFLLDLRIKLNVPE